MSAISSPGATLNGSSLEVVLGPMLIGLLLSTVLWGIICVQAYDYFITPNEDPRWQKWIIALLLFLATFDTGMNAHAMYYFLVKNFTNPYAILSAPWTQSAPGIINAFSSFIVRTMFARRVYLVSGKRIILCLWIMATSSAHFIVAILILIKSLRGPGSEALPSLSHLLYISFSFGTVSDASTTAALCWLLHSMKTGIRRTDNLVKVLMLYIVTTGLLVVTDSALGFVFFVAMPGTLICMAFYTLFGKLFLNAYLASLNAREKLSKNQTDIGLTLSRISDRTGQNVRHSVTTYDKPSLHRASNAMAINLRTSVEQRTDDHELVKNSSSAQAV